MTSGNTCGLNLSSFCSQQVRITPGNSKHFPYSPGLQRLPVFECGCCCTPGRSAVAPNVQQDRRQRGRQRFYARVAGAEWSRCQRALEANGRR